MLPFDSASFPKRAFRRECVILPKVDRATLDRIEGPGFDHTAIEIGCGNGWHSIQFAMNHPNWKLIAIERTSQKFSAFRSRLERHADLKNLIPIHGNAVSWLTHQIPNESVDRLLLMYPNPEKKDPRRRFHRGPFAQRILEVLKPGGTIYQATNEAPYSLDATSFWTQVWGLDLRAHQVISRDESPEFRCRTAFEKKYFERGETLYLTEFQKPGARI